MKVIGLTGGIASGKSTVSKMIRRHRIPVIDADYLARKVVEPGKPAYDLIVKNFSKNILLSDGTLDRTKLGNVIFPDENKRKLLNRCVHPFIRREIFKLVVWYWVKGESLVVLDAPLLIEGKLHTYMSSTIVVYCSEQLQINRMMERDGLSEQSARERIAAQMPINEKVRFADYVIDNSGDLSETERQVNQIMAKIKPKLWYWLLTWLLPPVAAAYGLLRLVNS
ncbi:2347_t:CDS:2 [Paraglomus brasilianum]|uniref:2347_t:CDS:1 n=1 Tax=Paraglomus brasilianum TaxID=144538 RepID=A0A9N9G037_9GLOM|nr:2347_t:CDS:2 [Paraglomus brasilianum]